MSTHEMTDAMKAEFVEAFQAKFGFGVMAASANDDAAAMMGAAAWAWQASREALVIDLPNDFGTETGKPFGDLLCLVSNAMLAECRKAIEAAGGKVSQ